MGSGLGFDRFSDFSFVSIGAGGCNSGIGGLARLSQCSIMSSKRSSSSSSSRLRLIAPPRCLAQAEAPAKPSCVVSRAVRLRGPVLLPDPLRGLARLELLQECPFLDAFSPTPRALPRGSFETHCSHSR